MLTRCVYSAENTGHTQQAADGTVYDKNTQVAVVLSRSRSRPALSREREIPGLHSLAHLAGSPSSSPPSPATVAPQPARWTDSFWRRRPGAPTPAWRRSPRPRRGEATCRNYNTGQGRRGKNASFNGTKRSKTRKGGPVRSCHNGRAPEKRHGGEKRHHIASEGLSRRSVTKLTRN